jgi:hypothetical protein
MQILYGCPEANWVFIVFMADRLLRFLGPHMRIQLVPGGQNYALECSEPHCWKCILPTRHQLNVHVRPLEMAVGRENDE